MSQLLADLDEVVRRQSQEEKAAEAVRKTRVGLVMGSDARSVFFATLALRLEVRMCWDVPTFATDGKLLLVNPDFCLSLSQEERLGVLLHEVMHPALAHHARRGSRDPRLWNVACFPAGTAVSLANGSSTPIEQVRPGQQVIGFSGGRFVTATVLAVTPRLSYRLVRVSSSKQTVLCTPDHLFLTTHGYVEAQNLNASGNAHRQLLSQGTSVRRQALPHSHHGGDRHTTGAQLRLGSGLSGEVCGAADGGEASELCTFHQHARHDPRVHRGARGWGGHHHHHEARAAGNLHHQHFGCPCGVVQERRLLAEPCEKHQATAVLEAESHRLLHHRRAGEAAAVPGDQEAARGTGDRVHHPQAVHAASLQAFGADGRDHRRDSGAEYTRATCEPVYVTRPVVVYDLTTTSGSFVANGFVVHNCDLPVNQQLKEAGFKLPACALYPGEGELKDLPPGLCAEEYYPLLPVRQGGDDRGDDPGGCGQVLDAGTAGKDAGGKKKKEQEDPQGEGDGSGSGGGEGGYSQGLDPAEAAQAEADWQVAVAQAAQVASQRGQLPAGLSRFVSQVTQPKVDWRHVLREFVARVSRNDFSWVRPNRRFVHQGLYLPGLRSEEIGEVICAVDTSGSIGQRELETFGGELEGILQSYDCNLTILYHDAEVAHVQRWRSSDGPLVLEPKGGGGTSHRPVFAWVEENAHEAACVVCLTDLFTEHADREPEIPVLWAVIGNPQPVAPWGQVLEVKG